MQRNIYLVILGVLFLAGSYYLWNSSGRYSPIPQTTVQSEGVDVTYKNKDGDTHTVFAYKGQIKILINPGADSELINSIVSKNSGEIVDQVPVAGIYLAQVPAGKEAEFIAALYKNEEIQNAFPNPIIVNNALIQIDNWIADKTPVAYLGLGGRPNYLTLPSKPGGIFELTDDPKKEASHAEEVRYLISGMNFDSDENRKCLSLNRCIQRLETTFNSNKVLTSVVENTDEDFILFNLSFGVSGFNSKNEKVPFYDFQESEKNWVLEYLNTLAPVKSIPALEKTIIIKSAGNEREDITGVFGDKRISKHESLNRILFAGAIDESGNIADYSNYSRNPMDVLYVPVKERFKAGYFSTKPLEGTSFAAPKITYLVNKILEKYPELAKNPKLLRETLFDGRVAVKKTDKKRNVNGLLKDFYYFAIEDPYNPETLGIALEVAKEKLESRQKETKEIPPLPKEDAQLKQKLFESPYPGDLLPPGPGIEE